MINRVLIRIKVVQLLYSYLLSQSEFNIEAAPAESASRDRRFAYATYCQLLLMILELSGFETRGVSEKPAIAGLMPNKHINRNAMARALNNVDAIRAIILKNRGLLSGLDTVIASIYNAIPTLPAYKSYIRRKDTSIKDDVELWVSILNNLISKNQEYITAARNNPDFTSVGLEKGIQMVVETLENYGNNRTLYNEAHNALGKSLDKAYELYHSLLLLPIEITRQQDLRLDAAKHKFYPTDDDLHPNTRFVDNKFVAALKENGQLEEYLKSNPISWSQDDILVKSLLDLILNSESYNNYMAAEGEPTFGQDCEFWRDMFKSIILPSDDLAEALESKSVYWNDDLHIMGTFLLKTVRHFAVSDHQGADVKLLPKYKDEEDSKFGAELFETAIKNYSAYRELIDRFVNSKEWESDRLAFMDVVIMVVAITELLRYPAIPVAVTLNEYIEIASSYSTPKSGQFIHGILSAVINHLREQGELATK